MVTVAIALMIVVAVAVVAWPLFNRMDESETILDRAGDPVVEGLVGQRDATYAAIKELEFDHETGKLSDTDYRSMRAKMETKAVAVLQELDARHVTAGENGDADGDLVIEREI